MFRGVLTGGGVITLPEGPRLERELARLAEQGFTEQVVGVVVSNPWADADPSSSSGASAAMAPQSSGP